MIRTNRKVYEEMIGLVLGSRPYRLFVNYPKQDGWFPSCVPEGRIGEGIQRLEVRWRLPCYSHDASDRVEGEGSMAAFQMDVGIPRAYCVLYLEKCSYAKTWIRRRDELGWRRLRASLGVFEEVVFRVVWKCPRFSRQDGATVLLLETVARAMGSVLGGADRGSDSLGEFIRFRPAGGRQKTGR